MRVTSAPINVQDVAAVWLQPDRALKRGDDPRILLRSEVPVFQQVGAATASVLSVR